jgi:hypothetical protein
MVNLVLALFCLVSVVLLSTLENISGYRLFLLIINAILFGANFIIFLVYIGYKWINREIY